ncbi:nicotinamide N-methyltransferase-like [Rana temporaria]|uniref:nicotinamide N-methyltransferase-like n=1 Tax=Rana temporaria TaxID=8407 RepID=UPI001AAC73BE|nr:nicotinamide N-methyltransferase-like [Rana temporaria]
MESTTMKSTTKKLYSDHLLDPKTLLETYFSPRTPNLLFYASSEFIMTALHKAFKSGLVKGKHLIDVSLGPTIHHLAAICEFLEEITVLEMNDACVKELEKLLHKQPDAHDWSHVSKVMKEITDSRDSWQAREEMLRAKLAHVSKCDFTEEKPTGSLVLPKADCLLSMWALQAFSKDHEAYLKTFSSYIKLGGYLMIYGDINVTFFTTGEHKYHLLTHDEDFVKKALTDGGFKILQYDNVERKTAKDLVDVEKSFFVIAQKVKEV